MADPITTLPLQVPTSTVKSALALQPNVAGSPYLIEYVLPGHPLILQTESVITSAITNGTLIIAAGAGIRTAVTMIGVFLSSTVSVPNVPVRIGFGSLSLPAEASTGVPNIVVNHDLTPGGGIVLGNGSSVFCIGQPNTALRITNAIPSAGKLVVLVSYFQPAIA